ncbi:MAG: glycosyltransferase [Verrucomicrobiota bacterium]
MKSESSQKSGQRVRAYYAAGPGDIVGTFQRWANDAQDERQFAKTYSEQFFSFANRHQFLALAVSTNSTRSQIEDRGITAKNRPLPFASEEGRFAFLGNRLRAALRVWWDIVSFRPDFAVIAEGTTFWTLLLPLKLCKVRVIPSVHCVLWPTHQTRSRGRKAFDSIEGWSLNQITDRCLSASKVIDQQLPKKISPTRFYPSYHASAFSKDRPPRSTDQPHRFFYGGRIEEDKGVLELLEASKRLIRNGYSLRLDFCGTGSALDLLKRAVHENELDDAVTCHGHCGQDQYRSLLESSDTVVVPTTSRFIEGFNQVVVEAVLSGRRVIATEVCPAAFEFETGVTVILPDSSGALEDAMRNEINSVEVEEVILHHSLDTRFFGQEHSWENRLGQVAEISLGETGAAT